MKHFLFFAFFVVLSKSQSAPPVDLSDVDGNTQNKKVIQRPLSEDEITFTNEQNQSTPAVKTSRMKYDVQGRSLPGRKGRNILPLKKGAPVLVLKESSDKRWWAIQNLKGPKARAWVPKASVQLSQSSAGSRPTQPDAE